MPFRIFLQYLSLKVEVDGIYFLRTEATKNEEGEGQRILMKNAQLNNFLLHGIKQII